MSNSNTDAFDMTLLGTLDPGELFEYCEKTGPNKIAEKYIATDASISYFYAIYVLKGRFELGEKTIAATSYWSYLYAKWVLKGRFELGESAIKDNGCAANWIKYKKLFNIED